MPLYMPFKHQKVQEFYDFIISYVLKTLPIEKQLSYTIM